MKIKGRDLHGLVSMASLYLYLYLCVSMEAQAQATKPIFINCGTNSSVMTEDGRFWIGDSSPNKTFSLSSPGTESVSSSSSSIRDSIGNHPLAAVYSTARVFSGEETLNYSIGGLSEGTYLVRLHFCPAVIAGKNQSSFGVTSNGLRLASELDVSGEIASRRKNNNITAAMVKEYVISIAGALSVDFEGLGFVSAIEVIPADSDLGFSERRGAETMYRLNVGGEAISPARDSGGMYRPWEVDSGFMITANAGSEIKNTSEVIYAAANESWAAPIEVYETARSMSNNQLLEKKFNMSWKLEVSPGFEYLVRLHFCELQYFRPKQRSFMIFLNNRTAAEAFDVFTRAGGINRAYHYDFSASVAPDSGALWVQLGAGGSGAAVADAFLNGLEVFKLSRSNSLAYVERFDSDRASAGNKFARNPPWVRAAAAGGLALIVVIVAVGVVFAVRRRRRRRCGGGKNGKRAAAAAVTWRPPEKSVSAGVSVRAGRRFSLSEIRVATRNFDEGLVIGVGGFGKVYKGLTEEGTEAAVKRANPQSEQGLSEFETEIEMLSKLRHRHLVSMIGYCEENGEMILVYEYMANGTLRSHLFGSGLPALTWRRRVEACIGAARGLHYLHTGADRGIIHRDVKTTNILLDEDFVAKMADFGLSKDGPALDHTHVSTAVKGSFGYLDPEYFRRQRLTEKSDVYSFGVVLFEAVCARAVINPTLPKDQINLAEWVMTWQRRGSLESVADPQLAGGYDLESMRKFGEIAEKCLADEGKDRPTMGEVLWHLEYVLQIHLAWLRTKAGEESKSTGIDDSGGV